MKNGVYLITYANSLGKNLKELELVLETYFKNIICGVHILPFYPSSGDRGFSPLTHLKVDPNFGDWEDIKRLSQKYDLIADIMVNHISAKSVFFKDYLEKGEKSKYADYFITNNKFSRRIFPIRKKTPSLLNFIEKTVNGFRDADKIFHNDGVNKTSLRNIYRPRTGSPFVPFLLKNGSIEYIWCTFTEEQIDLDTYNENVKEILKNYIFNLAKNGIKLIRLDAVGYAVKKRGTNCFMLPETYDFINWLGAIAHKNNVSILPEVHNHYSYQIELDELKEVDYVYDFQMSVLVLNAIYNKNGAVIKRWLKVRPKNIINVLDTHDGIPIVDVEDLLSKQEIIKTSKKILSNGGNEAKRASGDNSENVDTYQINCTYYSALGEDDDAYIVARAIQFFVPGLPQVYYGGFLAGKNDAKKVKKTNIGRDINRHNYTIEEINSEMDRNVVRRLMKLIKFRNNFPIFDGNFSVVQTDNKKFIFRWRKKSLFLETIIDLNKKTVKVNYLDGKTKKLKKIKF
ncbi:MAG TPA: sucrose phosphorylase [Candidatus Moranbacteria bacterium]|nr:sucrose phosphorylase [Candidatus Moranbacteria bacterium]